MLNICDPISHLSRDATDSMRTSSARHRNNPQQSLELTQQQTRLSILQKQIAKSQRRKAIFVGNKLAPLPFPTITPRDRLPLPRIHSAVSHDHYSKHIRCASREESTPCSSQVNFSSKPPLPGIKDPKLEQERKPLPHDKK